MDRNKTDCHLSVFSTVALPAMALIQKDEPEVGAGRQRIDRKREHGLGKDRPEVDAFSNSAETGSRCMLKQDRPKVDM